MIGKTLDHYRIIEPLGAGGMGEVYRARDTTLDRDVAIKVLPEDFAADPDRLARFEREAKLLAQLNHARIAGVYGFHDADGIRFIAMELVEGETLADRLASSGRLDVDEALDLACQIAEALEAAHGTGIIHRDLKPANVKVTPDGQVKVLDFGLAKAWEGEASAAGGAGPSEPALSHSPTMMAATRTGVIMGTAAYMSPEQARAKPLDRRADNWAFGCVLYEMLTGKQAFAGETVSDTMAAILKEEPDWEALPGTVPLEARRVLRRCLQKDAKLRLRDAGDAWVSLTEATAPADDAAGAGLAPTAAAARSRAILAVAVVVVVSAAALGYVIGGAGGREGAGALPVTLSINLPPDAPMAPAGVQPNGVARTSLALSRDGALLVYVALVDGETILYKHDMRTGESEPIPGTRGARGPFLSPEGTQVGYFAQEQLMVVALDGTAPRPLAPVKLELGGHWGEDDNIYFVETEGVGISSVPAGAGPVEAVTLTSPEAPGHGLPTLLPGSETFLFSIHPWLGVVTAGRSSRGEVQQVLDVGSNARYVRTGHLLFVKRGELWAVPFDLSHLQTSGPPVRLIDDLRTEELGAGQYTISDDGTLAYVRGTHASVSSFAWVDREGVAEFLPIPRGDHGDFRLSPDGSKLAFTRHDANGLGAYIYDFERGLDQRLVSEGRPGGSVWTADSRSVFYSTQVLGDQNVFWADVGGGGQVIRVTDNDLFSWPEAANERAFVYSQQAEGGGQDLWHVELQNGRLPADPIAAGRVLQANEFIEFFADLSPDGNWIAYVSERDGTWQVYVSPYPGMDFAEKVSATGGEEPLWNPVGGELIYRDDSEWWSVDVSFDPELRLGAPREVLSGSYINVPGYSWGISADGERFLVLESPAQSKPVEEIVVITNFFDKLRELAPTAR